MSKSLFDHTSFKWDPITNMEKVDLELISDADMYFFFEEVMKGGVSYISRRLVKPAVSIQNLMMETSIKSYYILIYTIIYIIMRCLNFFQQIQNG